MTRRILQLGVSQLISPFGPGAIVDILGESFVTMTADRWPKRALLPEIVYERLSTELGVQRFYGPPSVADVEDTHAISVDVARFPSWLFCQNCRRMKRWTPKDENGQAPSCPHDSGRLVPMRFVVVCRENSHATDVPWAEWLHRSPSANRECGDSKNLRFGPVEGGSPGLSGLEVTCDACQGHRTLGDLRSDVLSRDGLKCHGIQPWESEWRDCASPLEVLQRGATSFHYSETAAAIDIPEMSASILNLEEQITAHTLFLGLKAMLSSDEADNLARIIAESVGASKEVVLAVARREGGADSVSPTIRDIQSNLLGAEFEAFRAAASDQADEINFKTRVEQFHETSKDLVEQQLAKLVDNIILVDRLREVRACRGFKRYRPDANVIDAVPPHADVASWLPAAEGFGEGVFLRLNGDLVDLWASSPEVEQRVALLAKNYEDSRFKDYLHPVSAQYVALHSLAHALLKEFSFTSGYPAASLRERVYSEVAGEYGVFIYTTSSDKEGTLGGLVREGEPDRLGNILARAAEQLSWCSNDPVCSESNPQNLDGLNLAACHSCLLASETSCDGSNLLLDRVLLVGSDSLPGLLTSVVDAVAGHVRLGGDLESSLGAEPK